MSRRILACATVVLMALAMAGCTRPTESVSGTVRLEPKGTYLVGSTLVYRIVDVTGGEVVAETGEVLTPGWEALSTQPPVPFDIAVEKGKVDPTHTYVLWAEVDENGHVIAATERENVLTKGSPSPRASSCTCRACAPRSRAAQTRLGVMIP